MPHGGKTKWRTNRYIKKLEANNSISSLREELSKGTTNRNEYGDLDPVPIEAMRNIAWGSK